jgi:hypothetical protein
MPHTNGSKRTRQTAEPKRPAGDRQRSKLIAGLAKQINDIYLQLDAQLTRLAQIQLQLDALRSKVRRL